MAMWCSVLITVAPVDTVKRFFTSMTSGMANRTLMMWWLLASFGRIGMGDAERIGIMGGSYGGYMVAAALAFRPDVFKVGINIFGVTNWLRTLNSIPPWWGSFRTALYDEL